MVCVAPPLLDGLRRGSARAEGIVTGKDGEPVKSRNEEIILGPIPENAAFLISNWHSGICNQIHCISHCPICLIDNSHISVQKNIFSNSLLIPPPPGTTMILCFLSSCFQPLADVFHWLFS